MKILHKYIIKQVSVVFFTCLVVFTFVLFIGNMLRIIEMMAKGVGVYTIIRFLFLLIPFMLSYSIPISILTSALLVFARLSAENEITAIKATGISLKFIFKPVIIYAIIIVCFCLLINDKLRPNAIFNGRKLLVEIGMDEPMINITSGRFNEVFPNYVVYVGQKKGKTLTRVVVYKFEKDKLNSVITAESGEIVHENKKTVTDVYLKLYNGIVEEIPQEGQETGKVNRMQFDTYNIKFDLAEQIEDFSKLVKKEREMTNKELLNRVEDLNNKLIQPDYKQLIIQIKQEISSLKTRIHNRLAMAFSPLVFILVAIPLGIKVHRSETSIGAGISLMLVSAYYFLMTLGEAFQDKIVFKPWLLMWLPNAILFIIGFALIRRVLKK